MKSVKNRGILLFGFSLLIFVVFLISLTGAISLNKTNKLFEHTYSDIFAAEIEMFQANSNLIAVHRAMKDVALSKNAIQLQAALKDVEKYDLQIKKNFNTLSIIEANNVFLIEVIKAYKDWEPVRARTLELTQNGQYELAAENTRTNGAGKVKLIVEKMDLLIDQYEKHAQSSYEESKTILKNSLSILLWLTFCSLVLLILTSIFISRKLLNYENELQNEKEQLRITFESIGDGIITTDISKNVLRLNKVAEEMTGWTSEEALGKPFLGVFNIINSLTGEKGKDPVEEVLATDQICELANHTLLTSKDGTKRHIADSAAPIKDQNGNTTGVVMVFRDVTEKKTFQDQLRNSEKHYRLITENINDMISKHSLDGKYTFLSPSCKILLGYEPEELIGVNPYNLFHPKSIELVRKTHNKVLNSADVDISTYMIRRKDGTYVWLETSNKTIRDNITNKPVEILCVSRDITERKKAEEKIKQSEYMLTESQKVGHIGSYANDVINGTWACSTELERIFGVDEAYQHTLEGWAKIVHPDWRVKLSDYLAKVYADKTFFDMEYKIIRANDGVERWVHGLGKLEFDENGNVAWMNGTIQDITERKLKDEETVYRSGHDVLTGLYNRRKFEELLDFVEDSGIVPVSIIVGDVNSLKLINDAYGHNAGDIILKKIAEIIKEICGDNAYCARRGGDEFAIILPGTTYEEACFLVTQMKKRCEEESVDELILNITFGVVTKTEKEQSLEQCQHLAEERMYTGKLLEGKNIRSAIVENLRMALEEKTGETRNHCNRMSDMSQIIGEIMGFQAFEIANLKLLSLLHDIGKTAIPESILLKPGKLDEDEFSIMQKHCEIGYRIANTMPELVPIAEGILCHHERWDGNGYPQGLVRANIPIISRIVAVLDTYDAMTNDRPYRKALSTEEAIEEIKRCSGTQFDPEVVNVFLNNCIL